MAGNDDLDPATLGSLSLEELQAECKRHGIDGEGKKYSLVKRLQDALQPGLASTVPPSAGFAVEHAQPKSAAVHGHLGHRPPPMRPPHSGGPPPPRDAAWACSDASGRTFAPLGPQHFTPGAPPRRPAAPGGAPQFAPPQRPAARPTLFMHLPSPFEAGGGPRPSLQDYWASGAANGGPRALSPSPGQTSRSSSYSSDDSASAGCEGASAKSRAAPPKADAAVAARFAALLSRTGSAHSEPGAAEASASDEEESPNLQSRFDRLLANQNEREIVQSNLRSSDTGITDPRPGKRRRQHMPLEPARTPLGGSQSSARSASPLMAGVQTSPSNSPEDEGRPPLWPQRSVSPETGPSDPRAQRPRSAVRQSPSPYEEPAPGTAAKAVPRPPCREAARREMNEFDEPREHIGDAARRSLQLSGESSECTDCPSDGYGRPGSPGRRGLSVEEDEEEALGLTRRPLSLEQDGLGEGMDDHAEGSAFEAACPVVLQRHIKAWWARLQGCESVRASLVPECAAPSIIVLSQQRNVQVMKRRRQLRSQAADALLQVERAHSKTLAVLEAEAAAPVACEHQWLELAIDIRKHQLLVTVERVVAAGQGEQIDVQHGEETTGILLAEAYQVRQDIRENLLNHITEGGSDAASSRWREVQGTRISILQERQKEERAALQTLDNDLEQFDPELRSIEVEFQRKVRARGYADALLVPAGGREDPAERVDSTRTSVLAAGIDLEELARKLDQLEAEDEEQKAEVESVRSKTELLCKVFREGHFDESTDGVAQAPPLSPELPSPPREPRKRIVELSRERPAIARRAAPPLRLSERNAVRENSRPGASLSAAPKEKRRHRIHSSRNPPSLRPRPGYPDTGSSRLPSLRPAKRDSRSRSRATPARLVDAFAMQPLPRAALSRSNHVRGVKHESNLERESRPWNSERQSGAGHRSRQDDRPPPPPPAPPAPPALKMAGRRCW